MDLWVPDKSGGPKGKRHGHQDLGRVRPDPPPLDFVPPGFLAGTSRAFPPSAQRKSLLALVVALAMRVNLVGANPCGR